MTNTAFKTYANEHGGRVVLLLLLFLLAIYQFIHAGFPAFAVICLSPLLIIAVILAFRSNMLVFWVLIVVNAFLQNKNFTFPGPMSLYNEVLEILLLALALIDVKNSHFNRIYNVMLLTLMVWCGYCTLQILNDTCSLGMDVGAWYTGARLMAFQIMYAFLVFSIYISKPDILIKYLLIWGVLSLFAAFWTWKQVNLGLTSAESSFLYGRGRTTHLLQAGTLIRYFSTYSDAANFGIGIASTAVAFIIFGITAKIKKYKYFFLIVGVACAWAMFPSGTRTATACLMAGFMMYIFLSKSFKIAIPFSIIFAIFAFILAFTNIGQGNQQIRRMRTAFDRNDASANARSINQAAMKKYMEEAPFGIGIAQGYGSIPANNKYAYMSDVPADSEYVYIWIRTGEVGITLFIICTVIMLFGACWIVFFTLKSPSLRGIGAGMCCAFVSFQLGGYGNQVLMQFPNCLQFYGGLTIVYVLPYIEKEWIAHETKLLAVQNEKRHLRLEKIEKMRVKPWYSWIYKYL
jgi:hypothetical protein